MKTQSETQASNEIDITPSWGEWGSIYRRLAESGESKALRELRADFAKAMAAAQALHVIKGTLTDKQAAIVASTIVTEIAKQGY